MQNFIVISRVHFEPEHCIFWSNFEFDQNIVSWKGTWAHFNVKTIFPGMRIIKVRQSRDHLIFIMGIPIPVRHHLYMKITPRDCHTVSFTGNLFILFWSLQYNSDRRKIDNSIKFEMSEISTVKGLLNESFPSATYMCQWTGSVLLQVMACRLFGAKPLPEPIMTYSQMDPLGINFREIKIKTQNFSFMKTDLKMLSVKWRPFCPCGDMT